MLIAMAYLIIFTIIGVTLIEKQLDYENKIDRLEALVLTQVEYLNDFCPREVPSPGPPGSP